KSSYTSKAERDDDSVAAYPKAFTAFHEAGCHNIQMDVVIWAVICDKEYREKQAAAGIDIDEEIKEYVALNNRILAGLPEDLIVTTHVCRGNYRSTWHYSGGYDPVSEEVFGKENVDAY